MTTIRQLAHHTENEIFAIIVVVFVSGCILRSLLRTSMKVCHRWSVLRDPHVLLVLLVVKGLEGRLPEAGPAQQQRCEQAFSNSTLTCNCAQECNNNVTTPL